MRLFWIVWLLLASAAPAKAAPTSTLSIAADQGRFELHPFDYFIDESQNLQYADIEKIYNWQIYDKGGFNFGFSQAAYWLRFALVNEADEPRTLILEHGYPPTDHVDLYWSDAAGRQQHKAGGDRLLFEARDIRYRTINFKLTLGARETRILHLRIATESSIQGPVFLWSEQSFIEKASNELVGFSLYIGFILALGLYNIFLYFNMRDLNYIYYVIYVLSYTNALACVFGLTQQYVLPHAPTLANAILPISMAAGSISMLFFSERFLQTRRYAPRMSLIFRGLVLFAIATALASGWRYSIAIKMATFLTMIGSLVVLLAGLISFWKGYRPAKFFVMAFGLILVAVSIQQMVSLGIFPPVFFYVGHVASALEILLLSLALGDKLKYDQNQASRRIALLNEELKKEHDLIKVLNEDLEARVEEKTRDIRSMLEHIKLGIFTIGEQGVIHKDYSSYLEEVLQKRQLGGENAVELLQADSDISADSAHQLQSIIESMLGEAAWSFELNEGGLVREITKKDKQGLYKIVEIDWKPIINRRDIIEKILVTLRDVTQLREIQTIAEEKKKELEYISEIVPLSRDRFGRFMRAAEKLLDENERLISLHVRGNMEALKIIFINLHTLKGNSRAVGFKKMATTVHHSEQYVSRLQKGETPWSQELLLADLTEVRRQFDSYRFVNDKVLEREANRSNFELDIQHVAVLLQDIQSFQAKNSAVGAEDLLHRVDELLVRAVYLPADLLLQDIFAETRRLAKDLQKEAPRVLLHVDGLGFLREVEEILRNIFTHILRNSMDHGIEGRDERLEAGKTPEGRIELHAEVTAAGVEIMYRDDGRGLNLGAIRQLSVRRGLLDAAADSSADQLAELIFQPGFSTSHSITEISGRGVGMSAIRSYTEQAGGSLQLILDPRGPDLRFGFVKFSIRIVLPARFARMGMVDTKGTAAPAA